MKRPLRILSLLVVVLVLVRGSEYVLEAILDRELPPLLTEELGLPVRIAPIRADIISLTAKTSRLEMGEPDKLSIDASQVWVSLDWSDLLRGEIRLVVGGGQEVMVDISAWPKDDEPPSDNYAFLEQWLPSTLDAELVRYRRADGIEIEFHRARWTRSGDDHASLAWQFRFPTGNMDVDIDLSSLDDLLWLRDFNANLTLATDHENLPVSELALVVKPDDTRAYQLTLEGTLAGMSLTTRATGSERWSLPDRSETRSEVVYSGAVLELLTVLLADGEEDAYEREMTRPLPVIDLPRHDARLDISELRAGNELLHNVGFDISANGNYLALTEITASGLYGDLLGSAAVASVDSDWSLALAADMAARSADKGLLTRYITAHWDVRQGRVRLKSRGPNLAKLLEELAGDLRVSGSHRGEVDTPISLVANLDGSPDRFALEQIRLQVDEAEVTGQLEVSSRGSKYVNISARGGAIDLRFLLEEESELTEPGIALPTFLTWLPDYQVNGQFDFEALSLPDIELNSLTASLDRGPERGKFSITVAGDDGGSLGVSLDYQTTSTDAVKTNLDFELQRVDVSKMFGVQFGADVVETRSSGTISLAAEAENVRDIFASSQGVASLNVELRDDGDWSRETEAMEVFSFSGQTGLVIEGNSIVGVTLEDIDIDSLDQDINGTLSLIVTRDPVMVADLNSERLNVDRLVELFPDSAESADDSGMLPLLLDTPPGEIKIRVGNLTWQDRNYDDLDLAISSRPGVFDIEELSVRHREARVAGKLSLVRKAPAENELHAEATISGLRVPKVLEVEEKFLRDQLGAPLAGELRLDSSGENFQSMLRGLNGKLTLDAMDPSAPDPDGLDIDFERLPDGGLISVRSLKLAGSELVGELRTTTGTPMRYDLKVAAGTLDLRPWEDSANPEAEVQEVDTEEGALEQTAETARKVVGFAGRLLGGAGLEDESGEAIFSSDAFDLQALRDNNVTISGRLDRLYSSVIEAEGVQMDAVIGGGEIRVDASALQANGGPLTVNFSYNSNTLPSPMLMTLKGENVHRRPDKSSYPTSFHGILSSTGGSEAEVAANLNGQLYFELGRGPIDYRGLAFLTADAASSMINALIPGARDRVPEVRCGVTFFDVNNGKGVTPYGYAVQTRSANLLGGIEFDLIKERVRVEFQSRSRKGVGISIGNAFSSTVELEGPLNDPKIVPNTPGLLVRGWAAFMTAGLSVLGESVFNRVLASENPCNPIQEEIRKDVCSTEQLLTSSPLVCPGPAVATN